MAEREPLLLLPGLLSDGALWRAQVDGLADVAGPAIPDLSLDDTIAGMARRALALDAAVQSEYARLAGMSPAALTAAVERYLPILHAFALAERATNPARRARLIQRVEAALRPGD